MKILSRLGWGVIGLMLSAFTFAHTGHGQEASIFHSDVHTSWLLVLFVAAVVFFVTLIQDRKRK